MSKLGKEELDAIRAEWGDSQVVTKLLDYIAELTAPQTRHRELMAAKRELESTLDTLFNQFQVDNDIVLVNIELEAFRSMGNRLPTLKTSVELRL